MKLLIFGASGSGTTTLGRELERRIHFKHLDVDDYYWKLTEPPYQEKIPLPERNLKLDIEINRYENVIVCGSLVSWGEHWKSRFDLAVFIYLAQNIRMEKLRRREIERYGEKLQTDQSIALKNKAFLEWAEKYDDPDFTGRSLNVHNDWIKLLNYPVLRIEGNIGLNDRVERVLTEMNI